MLNNSDNLLDLFRKLAHNALTPEEERKLALAIELYPKELLDEVMEIVEQETGDRPGADPGELWPLIAAIPSAGTVTRGRLQWLMPAAAVFVAVVLLLIKWQPWSGTPSRNISHCDSIKVYMNGIPPGVYKASLTLFNGHQVLLDSTFDKLTTLQGGTLLRRLKTGEFQYTSTAGKASDTALYNSIATTRGTQCIVLLPDGSSARLNAESSIRFPLRFHGPAREVEIQGEVYFDIVKKPGMPFFVRAKTVSLEITGTSFNINAYDAEIATTLVKGSLIIQHAGERSALKPGQQATFHSTDSSTVEIRAADIEQVTSWKDGYIIFKKESTRNALKELARWYNLELVNPEQIPARRFSQVVVCRGMGFEELVKMLRSTGLVFRVEGRRLVF